MTQSLEEEKQTAMASRGNVGKHVGTEAVQMAETRGYHAGI